MRQLIILCLVLFVVNSHFAQTSRMNNSQVARTYTVEHQGQTNLTLLQEAERNYRSFQFEGTLFAIENAVAQNPYSAEALIMRARFKKRVGMISEAEADMEMARRINPYIADLYGYDGNSGLLKLLYFQPEKSIQSLSSFQKNNYYFYVLDNKRIEVEGEEEVLLLESVIEDIETENFQEALNTLETTISRFPQSAISYDLKGSILMQQEKYTLAVENFSKAVTLEPDFAIAWFNFGQVERKMGNLKTAKSYLDKAIDLQEDLTKAYFERASVLKAMGDKESALEDYNTIIDLKGNTYMEAFLNRGLTRKMLGDYGGALSDLNKALKEYPDNPELLKNRGNIQMLFGLHRKAIDDYTVAIQQDATYAEAYYNRALAHFLIFDTISGCADLEKSAELGFENAVEAQIYFCGQ